MIIPAQAMFWVGTVIVPVVGWTLVTVIQQGRKISTLEQIAQDVSKTLELLRDGQEKTNDRLYDLATNRGGHPGR